MPRKRPQRWVCFDRGGRLASRCGMHRSAAEAEVEAPDGGTWIAADPFNDTLEVWSVHGTNRISLKSTITGRRFPMYIVDVVDMLQRVGCFNGIVVDGRYEYIGVGGYVGIRYIGPAQ